MKKANPTPAPAAAADPPAPAAEPAAAAPSEPAAAAEIELDLENLEPHRIANRFPMLGFEELEELAQNITETGLLEEIVIFEGQVLDGRNRYAACIQAGIKPKFRYFGSKESDGASPAAFVFAKNVTRRHMTTEQKAAAIVAMMPDFEAEAAAGNGTVTQKVAAAAESMKISPRTAQAALAVSREAPEDFEKVKNGEMTVNAAEEKLRDKKKRDKKAAAAANPATDGLRESLYENLKERFGVNFADKVKGREIFSDADEIGKWMDSEPGQQRALVPFLMLGFAISVAEKQLKRDPVENDRIDTLLARAAGRKNGKLTVTVGGYTISVKPAPTAEDTTGTADDAGTADGSAADGTGTAPE